MELTSEKGNEPKAEPTGRRSFLLALFGVSGATVGALLSIPVIRFVTFPLRKNAADAGWSDLGPIGDFTALTVPTAKTITLERRDAWQSTTSQTAVYVLPPSQRTVSDTLAHLPAPGMLHPMGGC